MLRSVFDALPSLTFVVDEDVRIQECNAAAADFLAVQRSTLLNQRGGDVLHCLHADDDPEGCGRGPVCTGCVLRNSVGEAFRGKRTVRRRTRLEVIRDGHKIEIYALVTASLFCYQERSLALLVIEDISEIVELRRLIPICSSCRKVRDGEESWRRLESYFKELWDVDFTHGICPECFKVEMNKIEREIRARSSSVNGNSAYS
ncbi:MAG: PAS domain-containing protein [Desulfobacterales bacterium]